jgi:hypothetical protein
MSVWSTLILAKLLLGHEQVGRAGTCRKHFQALELPEWPDALSDFRAYEARFATLCIFCIFINRCSPDVMGAYFARPLSRQVGRHSINAS